MPVVTIARLLGSGAEEIAATVGSHLRAPVVDRELVELAAANAGLPIEFVESLDERGRSMWRRPLDLLRLVAMPPINPEVPDVTGDRYPPTGPIVARGEGLVAARFWAAEAYASLLARTMRALAEPDERGVARGNVVIVGRAGNEALADLRRVLNVLVIGSDVERIARVMAAESLGYFAARDRVRQSDRDRRNYHKQFHHQSLLDPSRYDLVVNTDGVPLATAVSAIVTALEALAAPAGAAPGGEPAAA
jgi:cytidylate kinase